METLEQHRKRQKEEYESLMRNKGTNIECPYCKDIEMLYASYGLKLLTARPQTYVYCPECNYKTTIYT